MLKKIIGWFKIRHQKRFQKQLDHHRELAGIGQPSIPDWEMINYLRAKRKVAKEQGKL